MLNQARGYIASGDFHGYRVPQHLQNQIVKSYCDSHGLEFVLSRAEYWISGSTQCQLWAALNEGFSNIVFFSLWQLPSCSKDRQNIYDFILSNHIVLHFAAERLCTNSSLSSIEDLELLIQSNLVMFNSPNMHDHLLVLRDLT